jgi:hypothetical protein
VPNQLKNPINRPLKIHACPLGNRLAVLAWQIGAFSGLLPGQLLI